MRELSGYRFLIVSSELERVDATPRPVTERQIAALEKRGVSCELVVDLTQSALEKLIICNNYDAILPVIDVSAGTMHSEPAKKENFSIPLLLEQVGAPIIGCSHYGQLLTMDKTVSLRRAGCGVPGALITRQMWERGEMTAPADHGLTFPLFVKPNAMCASFGIGLDNVVTSPEQIKNKIDFLFQSFPEIHELRLERDMSGCRQFTVAVVGNPPAFCTSVVEFIYPPDARRIYDRASKKTDTSTRAMRYAIVKELEIRSELAYYAQRAFTQLGMRDYARFDFFYEREPFLHDVNSHPTLGNSFSYEWANTLDVPIDSILAFPLAAFHYRQQADGQPSRLSTAALDLVPPNLGRLLVSPAPVTAPPEYTTPHRGCRSPERYRAVDGTAVEVEVLRFLEALIGLVKPQYVLETGTYLGASAEAMARALLREGVGTLTTLETDGARVKSARRRLAGLPAQIVHANSLDYTPSAPIDLLFLDSSRSLREQEFHRFRPFLHQNSVIVWHDAADHHPGVPEALRRLRQGGIMDLIRLPTPRGISLSMLHLD